jgi:hypothetical protein
MPIYNRLVAELAKTAGQKVPYLYPVETQKPDVVTFVQDFGEFASVLLKGHSEPGYLALGATPYMGQTDLAEVFMRFFQIPKIQLGLKKRIWGQAGGNIEATPNGIVYIGDSADETPFEEAPSPDERHNLLFEQIKKFGNPDAIKLKTKDWLSVGHVDEYVSFTPANNSCGYTMFYAKPLEGLKTLVLQATDEEFAAFSAELADLTVLGRDQNPMNPEVLVGIKLSRDNLTEALASFRKPMTRPGLICRILIKAFSTPETGWQGEFLSSFYPP